jgi:hypothetical protein
MTGKIINSMIHFFGKDKCRIAHALKVYGYTLTIAELEEFSLEERETAVFAAVLHDLGIKIAEDQFGSCTFDQQEELGPPAAAAILEKLAIPGKTIDRVCFLISHHHTPDASKDRDFRALIEADFIVNFEENNLPLTALEKTRDSCFSTQTGKSILRELFPEENPR